MPVRTLVACTPIVCMLLFAYSASAAQLYKWVDERGVTNYSDQAPAASVKKRGVIEDRVSVYTPDPQLTQAMLAERARAIDDLRTGRRARDIQADWLARQYLAAARSYPVDPCAGSYDPQCTGYTPYAYTTGAYLARGRQDPRILPQITLTPGTTAGNVTGSTGYIPGNSAFAHGPSMVAPRRVLESARVGGGAGRSH
jgi:hypothetical protein